MSTKTVRRLVDRHELNAVRPTPRSVRFEASDVERFITERTEVAS